MPFVDSASISKKCDFELWPLSKFWALRCSQPFEDAEAALASGSHALRHVSERAAKIFFVRSPGHPALFIFQDVSAEPRIGAYRARTTNITNGTPLTVKDGAFVRLSVNATFADELAKIDEICEANGLMYDRVPDDKRNPFAYIDVCLEGEDEARKHALPDFREVASIMPVEFIMKSDKKNLQMTVRARKDVAFMDVCYPLITDIANKHGAFVWFRPGCARVTARDQDSMAALKSELADTCYVFSDVPPPRAPRLWSEVVATAAGGAAGADVPAQAPAPPVVESKQYALKSLAMLPPIIFEAAARSIGATLQLRKSFLCYLVTLPLQRGSPLPVLNAVEFPGMTLSLLHDGLF
jgi:hypothetical protein